MLNSTGYVLAAGALVMANEAIFAPIVDHTAPWTSLNWRLVPATAVMAILIGGAEKLNAPFGKALGGLVLLSVLVIPFGKTADSPSSSILQNIAKVIGV
jgi:hypothetical protein